MVNHRINKISKLNILVLPNWKEKHVGKTHMGLSENSVPHCTQWFCWSLSLWKMAISLGVYTIFRHTHIAWMVFLLQKKPKNAWAIKDTTTENASAVVRSWERRSDLLWSLMACPYFCSFNKRFEMSNSNWRLTSYIIERTDAQKNAFHPLIGRNKNQQALVHRHSMPFQKKTRHWTAWEPRVTRHDGKCEAMTDINATAGRSDIKSHSHLSVGRWMFT